MEASGVEYTFTAIEIDLDYEFDAARYFDFCREESLAETREAELWFFTAPCYPPSPFVAKLIPDAVLLQNVNTSPKPKQEEDVDMSESSSDIEVDEEVALRSEDNEGNYLQNGGTYVNLHENMWRFKCQPNLLPSGTYCKNFIKNGLNANAKKPYRSRTSTLMKPTASALAKQNQPTKISERFEKHLIDKIGKSSCNSCGTEAQAAKRQKLEGGHLSKVAETKQQLNFVHKLPKKDGNADGSTTQAKTRLTIPREPDLETAHRAQRTRPKAVGETENFMSNVRRFKALPLNRKILDAPSLSLPKRSAPRVPSFQEFHLKTSARAMQQPSAIPMTSTSGSNYTKESQSSATTGTTGFKAESKRSTAPHTSKLEAPESSHKFRALLLNKKILSSKGDIGVFRNSKRDITVPMEFNFHTDWRVQYNPPTDLFNKLSLTSGTQSNTGLKLKLQQPPFSTLKGSKENRWDSFQHEDQVKHAIKGTSCCSGGNLVQFSSNSRSKDGLMSGSGRTYGLR